MSGWYVEHFPSKEFARANDFIRFEAGGCCALLLQSSQGLSPT